MSADWLAAGPRGRKNPEPGQQSLSLCLLHLSLCLLQLFSDSLLLLPLLLRPTLLLVELVLLLSLLFLFARSLLEALLVYEFSFFIFRLLVVSANSSFSGDRSILGAFPPSSLSGSLSSEAPFFFSNKLLSLYLLVSCVRGLGSWVVFLCLLSLLSSFHDRLTFHVRPAIFTNGAQQPVSNPRPVSFDHVAFPALLFRPSFRSSWSFFATM